MPDVVSSTPSGDHRRRRLRRLDRSLDDTRLPFALLAPPRRRRVVWTDTPWAYREQGQQYVADATSVSYRPPGFRLMSPTLRAARRRSTNVCNLLIQFSRNAHPRQRPSRRRSRSHFVARYASSAAVATPLSRRSLGNRPLVQPPVGSKRVVFGHARPACALFACRAPPKRLAAPRW
jgi:hypothetical protein